MPADGKCGRHTPEESVVEVMARRVGIVVKRVGSRIVIIDRPWLIIDDACRLIIRHIDNVFGSRRYVDHAFFA